MQVTDEMVRVALDRYGSDDYTNDTDAMRAALTTALAAMWRDIKDAPKDGTEVIAFTHHAGDEFYEEPFSAIQIISWDDGCPNTDFYRPADWYQQKIGEPTHYMPLPSPPTQTGG